MKKLLQSFTPHQHNIRIRVPLVESLMLYPWATALLVTTAWYLYLNQVSHKLFKTEEKLMVETTLKTTLMTVDQKSNIGK